MHSKGKAAATGRLVKRDHKPFVAEHYSEELVHSYLFQVCLQPARHVDPGCLCWEGMLLLDKRAVLMLSVFLLSEFYVSGC